MYIIQRVIELYPLYQGTAVDFETHTIVTSERDVKAIHQSLIVVGEKCRVKRSEI